MEQNIKDALDRMTVLFGKNVVSTLLQERDNGGNSLAHLAVQKSLTDLIAYILPKVPEAHKILNDDGYNPLHLAVQMNNTDLVRSISKQEHFNVNEQMHNGETALHIADQLGDRGMLEQLIE